MMPHAFAAASWRFGSPGVLLLLLAIPLVGIALWAAFRRARRALTHFAGQTPLATTPSAARAGAKNLLICAGLAFVVVALARPQADPEEETVSVRGRDVVFLVDVSRSMLSKDAVPNRLGRAKLWINDLVNTLQGDRVALVAFAGVPVVKSPLTMDYGFFRMALDELGPSSVPRGGTLIGDAIRKAMSDVFEPGPGRFRDVVLISDGEDQGSFPQEAAKQAAEQGVRLIVIGIGSEVEGVPVPAEDRDTRQYVEYHGERVRSKMEGTTLAAIASAAASAAGESGGGGVFLNVGTGTINLDKVYHDLAGSAEQRETETKSNVTYRELFPYFLAAGALCLMIESLIRVRVPVRQELNMFPVRGAVLAAVVLLMVSAPRAHAQTPASTDAKAPEKSQLAAAPPSTPAPLKADELYNQGREAFLAGKFPEAGDLFRKADLESPNTELSARARYNLGQALLKQAMPAQGAKVDPEKMKQQLAAAADAFKSTLDSNPDDSEAARNVEIVRKMIRDIEEQQKKQQQQNKDHQKQDQKSQDQQNQGQKNQDQQNQDQSGKQDQSLQSGGQNQQSKQHQQNAEKLKDLAKQQSEAADKSKDASAQQQPQQREEKSNEAEAQQDTVNEQTQEQAQQQASRQAQEQLEKAQQEQKAASAALERGETKKAEEHQRRAAEHLDDAAKSEQQAAEESKQAEQKESKDQKGKEGKEGKEAKAKDEKPQYNQTASQLLDKERRERDARQQMLRALRGKPQPVEKDW